MGKQLLILVCLCLCVGQGLAYSPDSAIIAATGLARSHQAQGVENYLRWERMNVILLEGGAGTLQPFQQIPTARYEDLWWKHAEALPLGLRDSVQHHLGMLELLSQTVERADGELARLIHSSDQDARMLGQTHLHEIAVALEDANIIHDKLLGALQDYQIRQVSPSGTRIARQHFRDGMSRMKAVMLALKTSRQQEVRTHTTQLRGWMNGSLQRRKAWKQTASFTRDQEQRWMKWDRAIGKVLSGLEAWQAGEYPQATRYPGTGWSRDYLWYNLDFLGQVGGKEESLAQMLQDFWLAEKTYFWPESGLFPAFRPIGIEEEVLVTQEINSWIFVVDVSGSMQEEGRLPLFRRALAGWASQQEGNQRISLITFSDTARLLVDRVPATQYQDVLNHSGWLTSGGKSNILAAMNLATDLTEEQSNAKVVLVTDGGLHYDVELAALAEQLALHAGGLDALFLPAEDARYREALEKLVRIGGGRVLPLNARNPSIGL